MDYVTYKKNNFHIDLQPTLTVHITEFKTFQKQKNVNFRLRLEVKQETITEISEIH